MLATHIIHMTGEALLSASSQKVCATETVWKVMPSANTSSAALAPAASFGSRPMACRKAGPAATSTALEASPIHSA